MRNISILLKNCLSKLWNKQFLIFLFFLALSTTFWIFQTLNETYEEEIRIPLELQNVPKNVVVTTSFPSNLQVTLKDKGIVLLAYQYTRKFKSVVINFHTYANSTGIINLQSSELLKQVSSQLLSSTQLLSIKPETLRLYYNYGEYKRVPVVLTGSVKAARLYTIAATQLSADSVTVYAQKEQLDTITAAYINPLNLHNLNDTTRIKADFTKVAGVKFVPSYVNITFYLDRLVEKNVQVPVQQVNFPASKQLRTFPTTVNVSFQVGMGLYRNITSENFILVVNYEDLLKNKTNRCHLSLKTIPTGVSHVRITPQDVEYVIEEIPDNETENDDF